MITEILLVNNRGNVIIDAKDLSTVRSFHWYLLTAKNGKRYAASVSHENGKRRWILMHRLILGITDPSIEVDHRDNDGLNNQRQNLRPCTKFQNQANQTSRRGRSRFKGVYFCKLTGRWKAQITHNKKTKHLGRFDSEDDAARAYDAAAAEKFKDFANLNFLEAQHGS